MASKPRAFAKLLFRRRLALFPPTTLSAGGNGTLKSLTFLISSPQLFVSLLGFLYTSFVPFVVRLGLASTALGVVSSLGKEKDRGKEERAGRRRRANTSQASASASAAAAAAMSATATTAAPRKWEGVDEALERMVLETCLDEAPERRRVREAFKGVQLSIDHCLLKGQYDGIRTKESYELNSRGVEIFSKCWLPENCCMKAIVCLCHGYGDTCTFFLDGIARKIASAGYGVFALDYPGFGLSEGFHGYIPNFNTLIDDVAEHFAKIKENPEHRGIPCFLFGQSMGGAVALKVHFKQPNEWNGAILVAPMCKIADDVVPPWPLQQLLIFLAKLLPKEKLVPQKDLAALAFKDEKKREQTSYNVIAYKDKPRLRTALEMLRTAQEIEDRLEEVSLPMIVLHGESDLVTDPAVSKALYEKARSLDKKLCLYKDAYHAILEGESDETIFKVLDDIISWLDEHSRKEALSLQS